MRKLIFILLLTGASTCTMGCGEDENTGDQGGGNSSAIPKDEGVFRIVTYNVATFSYNKRLWPEGSYRTIADMMKEIEADHVCLNEVDYFTSRGGTNNIDQAKYFAELMGGWDYAFGPGLDPHPTYGGKYGEAMVSKARAMKKDYHVLPHGTHDQAEPRVLVVMEFDNYIMMTTHLEHIPAQEAWRETQMTAIEKYIRDNYGSTTKPIFLAGDLNTRPTSTTIKQIKQSWTILSNENLNTYPADNADRTIDYILAYKNGAKYTVSFTTVPKYIKAGNIYTISDHLPVVVDVKLP